MGKEKRVRAPRATIEKLDLSWDDCPRCGGTHKSQEVVRFNEAGAVQGYDYRDELEAGWGYWAWCPFHEEPVLLNVDVELEPVPEASDLKVKRALGD